MHRPASTNLTEEVQRLQDPMRLQTLDLLQSLSFNLSNKTIPQETANNLTQVKIASSTVLEIIKKLNISETALFLGH